MTTRGTDAPIRARRTALGLLAAATSIGALGLAAGGSAGALLAAELTGNTAWAGVPLGMLVVGSAAGALLIAWRTNRAGRASALVLGYGIGTAGAAIVIAAAVAEDFVLLLLGSAALGAANAAIFPTRYAAAELGGEAGRGRALGVVLFATALGAVASPNLLGPSGDLAEAVGLPPLTGLYLVAAAAFVAAGLLLTTLRRRSTPPRSSRAVTLPELRAGLRGARLSFLVLAAGNLVMVAVMAIAPVHLAEHGHSLDVVGVVISVHVLCMFGPSPLTGWLADRAGSVTVAGIGAALLAAAGLSGALLDVADGLTMTVVLALLGLGWNAAVVGGSTMLTSSVPALLRPHVEGLGEIAMGLAAGAGAPVAGLVVAFGDFTMLSVVGCVGGLLMLAALGLGEQGRPEAAAGPV
jgi:MFS family permease